MSAEESLMPSSEGGKVPQSYNIESGDAKFNKGSENVDVQTSTKLIGLTKEQLEKYRNDPFWRPVRYALFVMFWAVWIVMFGGAIVIVALSPKCDAKTAANWDQIAVHYQLFTPAFHDINNDGIGDFKGMTKKMDLLRKLGVTSVWASPVIATHKDSFDVENVIDLDIVDPRYGSEAEFAEVVHTAHGKGIKFVMDLPLSVSKQHEWNADAKYVDYVEKPEGSTEEFVRINLKNPEARDAVINSAIKFALLGVDGFHVNDKLISGYPNISAIIKDRLNATEELRGKEFIFFSSGSSDVEHSADDGLSYTIRSISDLNGGLCNGETSDIKCIRTALKTGAAAEPVKVLPFIWKNGDINSQRADQRFQHNATEIQTLLTMIQLVLPGPVQTYYGEELGLGSTVNKVHKNRGAMQWDKTNHAGFTAAKGDVLFGITKDFESVNFDSLYNHPRSSVRIYQKLAKLRLRTEVIQFGEISVKTVGDLIVISRYVSETSDPIFVLVANLPEEGEGSAQTLTFDETIVPGRPFNSAEISIGSPNSKLETHHRVDLTKGLSLAPFEGVVLKF
ncbi:hypothetical protein QR680_002264 [Steinernema hermaphroditum]|uniref:Glycosyl hydrolase family 13 catalytic domain-containing protein n=1 Tax=Steinernema hermaphroditum TaxID=289476 RepID=A0AA39H233_9BILA|nr:hypothetical protein QR680_002264 [Steinernema hermaphroditum]